MCICYGAQANMLKHFKDKEAVTEAKFTTINSVTGQNKKKTNKQTNKKKTHHIFMMDPSVSAVFDTDEAFIPYLEINIIIKYSLMNKIK